MNNYVFKKKKKQETASRSENTNLDSCHLIKNNECSGGFNFLSPSHWSNHNRLLKRKEEVRKHSPPSASASTCNLQTTIYQQIWQGNSPKRQLEMSLLACWASVSEGAQPRVGDGSVSVPSAAFPPPPWHTVMPSHNSLMANDANVKCKVSLIWPLLNS